jgi:hypothetical protein
MSADTLLALARECGAHIQPAQSIRDKGVLYQQPALVEMTAPQLAAFAERIRQEQLALIERLRLEAQAHAQEARTQRAIVREIYQLVTGATGEPGDWNGVEPVRQALERIRQDELERAILIAYELLGSDAAPIAAAIRSSGTSEGEANDSQ